MTTQVLFKTADKTFAIEVQHVTPHVVRILDALSGEQTLHESGFELDPTPHHVLVNGDFSYGYVTHVSVWNGHLILIASVDDSEIIFSPTAPRCEVSNDLPAELIALMDEDCTLAFHTLHINPLGQYIVGQQYDCSAI